MILRTMRKYVYRTGLRPKPGSIFFSPSRDLQIATSAMSDQIRIGMEEGMMKANNQAIDYEIRLAEKSRKEKNMPLTINDIESRFGFHKATIEGVGATTPRHAELRAEMRSVATYLNYALPDGREKSLAMTALEEASMWAHKSTAQSAPLDES